MSQIISLGAWYLVPNLVTNWIQSIYYRLTIRAGDHIPQPGSLPYEKHKRKIFVIVIIAYLVYTIYEADWDLQRRGDFYRDLGLKFDTNEKNIQSRFRKLTVLFHPDKLQNPSSDQIARAQAFYVHLKNARDTLVDPAKRFAYERLGPDMLEWKHCLTKLDFIKVGVKQIVPYYLVSALTLVAMEFFGYSQHGRHWQCFSLAAMLVFEAHIISLPSFPRFLTAIVNPILQSLGKHQPYLPFQAIIIARRISISIFIAITHVAPRFVSSEQGDDIRQGQQTIIRKLNSIVHGTNNEIDLLLKLETIPFNDSELEAHLRRGMKHWAMSNHVLNDENVQAAIARKTSMSQVVVL